jgi:hypothetical protein
VGGINKNKSRAEAKKGVPEGLSDLIELQSAIDLWR